MSGFAHLSLHTEYSITDSVIRINALVDAAADRDLAAVAITDSSNLFAVLKFNEQARAKKIKPIFGCDVRVMDAEDVHDRLILIAKNDEGLANLIQLISMAYYNSDSDYRTLLSEWVKEHNEGLIALSGGMEGKIGRLLLDGEREKALATAEYAREIFGDRFYIEVTRIGRDQEQHYIAEAVSLADECGLPLVATNDVRFLDRDDYIVHETRYCIAHKAMVGDGSHRELYTEEQYLKSADEMRELFSDIPDAVENTVEIVKRCTTNVRTGEYFMPKYRETTDEDASEILRKLSRDNLERYFEDGTIDNVDGHSREEYEERLEFELGVITDMGFAGYFLVVYDILEWTRQQGIAVGPGRGSGAASLVSFVLRITTIDPIKHELMFERLLNPERVSMPDFDIDFCMNRRKEVIDHVTETYGKDSVGQIVTFDTLAAKAVVRDVTRVLGKPYGLGESIVTLIPNTLHITLQDAIDRVPELRALIQTDVNVMEVIDRARQLEGVVRNFGRHAGGLVISPSRLDDYVPTFTEQTGGEAIVQYDKTDVEDAGLVKFDFLSLKTVTVVDQTCKAVNEHRRSTGEELLDPENLPLDDVASYQLLRDDKTKAVFQLESGGMRRVLRQLQPDCLEDIIALVALFRPGPIESGVVDKYVDRKHGREAVSYQHPMLRTVLEKSHGVMVYQEDVMRVAQELAGFSMGEADQLRRAMGKKVQAEIVSLRKRFVAGAIEKNVDSAVAHSIYDDMEKFAQYAFNRAHACGYAIVAVQTAYLKAHFPAEFMAANLTCDHHDRKSIVALCEDAKLIGLTIEKPNVNDGLFEFTGHGNTVSFGLGAIKGVGRDQIVRIVASRNGTPFKSLFEFCERLGDNRINRKMLESLIHSGALDCLEDQSLSTEQMRANLLANYETAAAAAEQNIKLKEDNATDLFGEVEEDAVAPRTVRVLPRTFRQILDAELDVLGVCLSGHPMDAYRDELRQLCSYDRLDELKPTSRPTTNGSGNERYMRRSDIVAGVVKDIRTVSTRDSEAMAVVSLDDGHASVDMTLYGRDYLNEFEKLKEGELIVVECSIQNDKRSDGYVLRGRTVHSIEDMRTRKKAFVVISVDASRNEIVGQLKNTLKPSQKGRPIKLKFVTDQLQADIDLGRGWYITPNDETLMHLKQTFGADAVWVEYPSG